MAKTIVCSFVFTRHNDALCVLAVQRGKNVRNHNNEWCVPGGHVESIGEDIASAALRELYEETNLALQLHQISPLNIEQECLHEGFVIHNYYSYLDSLDCISVNNCNCEPYEIKDVRWLPVTEVDNYVWAFSLQKDTIKTLAKAL